MITSLLSAHKILIYEYLLDVILRFHVFIQKKICSLLKICKANKISATFFELTTALAFMIFQEEKCDFIVLEVGLGGRLDSTNVISKPSLSVITSVQFDHTNILGNSLEKIALEKAGIMKTGAKVFIGPESPIDTLKVGYIFFSCAAQAYEYRCTIRRLRHIGGT